MVFMFDIGAKEEDKKRDSPLNSLIGRRFENNHAISIMKFINAILALALAAAPAVMADECTPSVDGCMSHIPAPQSIAITR